MNLLVNGINFKSRNELKDYCREIGRSYELGDPLQGTDREFMKYILMNTYGDKPIDIGIGAITQRTVENCGPYFTYKNSYGFDLNVYLKNIIARWPNLKDNGEVYRSKIDRRLFENRTFQHTLGGQQFYSHGGISINSRRIKDQYAVNQEITGLDLDFVKEMFEYRYGSRRIETGIQKAVIKYQGYYDGYGPYYQLEVDRKYYNIKEPKGYYSTPHHLINIRASDKYCVQNIPKHNEKDTEKC